MTVEQTTAERVVAEIARIFKKDASEITRQTRFAEDLGAKSVNIVQLVAVLENNFGIAIPFMEAKRQLTVGDAIDFVVRLRKA
ncbi:MAG: acyl carrier protein [Bauldia sp.]|nr:acyl carrier protein [Bauldia sp.]